MAEDTAASGKPIYTPGTITREALGRIAQLGDLYNGITEKFCSGMSIFRQQLPDPCPFVSRTENPHSDISFTTSNKLSQNLQNLDVSAELKLSVLAGFCELNGSAKYLNRKKDSFKSVECTMTYSVRTVSEHLVFSNDHIKEFIYGKGKDHSDCPNYPKGTYVVVGIQWGARCIVTVTDQNHEEKHKKEIEGKLSGGVKYLSMACNPSGSIAVHKNKTGSDDWKNYRHEIFGDVLPEGDEEFPQSLDGAMGLMRKLPHLVLNSNQGKGKPLTYILMPVSCVYSTEEPVMFKGLDEVWTTRVVNVFENISEAREKVKDQIKSVHDHSYCVKPNELEQTRRTEEQLDEQEAEAKTDFARHLKEIRLGAEEERLKEFCEKHNQKARDILCEFSTTHETVRARIEFAKRSEKFGAKYLPPPVDERIAGACDDHYNVYVLFHGDSDLETTMRNESVFVELAKENMKDSKSACYFTWFQQDSGNVRIKHFWNGKLVNDDVAKESETTNVAKCLPAAGRGRSLVPFRVPCPGPYDGNCSAEAVFWTCFNCNETLQYCPYYHELYCKCGRASVYRFRLRCARCSDFKQLRGEALHRALARLVPEGTEGNYLVELFIASWL